MSMPLPVPDPVAFGRRLVGLREARGIRSQRIAARLLDVQHERYAGWEKGRFPRAPELMRLAAVLGVTTDWLLTGSETGLTREAWTLLHEERPAPPPRRGRRPRLSGPIPKTL